jgi:hypothetical protein
VGRTLATRSRLFRRARQGQVLSCFLLLDPRPKSSSPELEYLDPLPYTLFDNKCVHDIASWIRNGRPYLNRDVGVAPIDLSDDSIGRGRVGLGWNSEEIRQAEDHLAREDSEIDGLVLTHVKPPVRH